MTPEVRAGDLTPYDSWRHGGGPPVRARHPARPRPSDLSDAVGIEEGLARSAASPVRLIWGLQDCSFAPQFLDRFLEFFPQAEVHPLADAGHYVVEDAYERIVPLLEDFLRRHPVA